MKRLRFLTMAIVVCTCIVYWELGPHGVYAGEIEPPPEAVDGTGQPVSTMHTLDEIYNLIDIRCPPSTSTEAGVPQTGQKTSYAAGDDGDFQNGVTWPDPRFTDNGNGTVTDNLTGLIWLKNANCFGSRPWSDALSDCSSLSSGGCGLTDDSIAGDWRLPNVKELESLVHYGVYWPVLSDTAGTGQWSEDDPFTGVQTYFYWSSTTLVNDTSRAWNVDMAYGYVTHNPKTSRYVWPVRGGQ